MHGHQGLAKTLAQWDLATYPGCAPGGLADSVYERGRPFSMLAHSDFHVHKQEIEYDFPMGIFNHNLVGVPAGDHSPRAILAGLRAGRTCASQGFWLKLEDFCVGAGTGGDEVGIGGTWKGTGGGADLRIRLDSEEDPLSLPDRAFGAGGFILRTDLLRPAAGRTPAVGVRRAPWCL